MTTTGPPSRLVGLGTRRPRPPALGEGGQGYIYCLEDDPDMVIKVFRRPGEELSGRLRSLATQGQRLSGMAPQQPVAWPGELVLNEDGEVGGYLMRRYSMPAYHRLETLFTPVTRREAYPQADWKFLVGVARNLAAVVAGLHNDAAMFVVGDLSPANIVISDMGYVTLLDSDSMQFRDLRTRELFPSTAMTPNYAPPELQSLDFPRSAYTDNFSLAVIVLQLLMCGEHPFSGQPADGTEAQFADNIREARSHLVDESLVRLPPVALNPQVLPDEIRAMAVRAFREGRLDARQRPSARQWIIALDKVMATARTCSARHTFSTSYGECPWCERLALRLPDPFGKRLPADYEPTARIRAAVAGSAAGSTTTTAARPGAPGWAGSGPTVTMRPGQAPGQPPGPPPAVPPARPVARRVSPVLPVVVAGIILVIIVVLILATSH